MLPGDFEGALSFIERFVDVGLIPISIASVVMMAGGAIGALSDVQVKINVADSF